MKVKVLKESEIRHVLTFSEVIKAVENRFLLRNIKLAAGITKIEQILEGLSI